MKSDHSSIAFSLVRAAVVLALGASTASAESPAVVDANGELIGSYSGPSEVIFVPPGPGSGLRVVSVQGFLFGVGADGSLLQDGVNPAAMGPMFRIQSGVVETFGLWYESADCSGPPYLILLNNFGMGGFVVRVGTTEAYYVPRQYQPARRSYLSRRAGSQATCESASRLSEDNGVPAFENDPAVTGVRSAGYPGPIRIANVAVPRTLFRDSFESLQT